MTNEQRPKCIFVILVIQIDLKLKNNVISGFYGVVNEQSITYLFWKLLKKFNVSRGNCVDYELMA